MTGVTAVRDEAGAVALAERLNRGDRSRPVVVVTIPSGRDRPWIDADRIDDEVGDVAEVVLMPTGPHTWEFSHRMPEQTQVYGGAGRVYPPDHHWVTDVRRSPLRFAFDQRQGAAATEALIEDALRMAAAAGLFAAEPSRTRSRREGVVEGVFGDSRAMVRLDRDLAAVPSELAFTGVPIGRVLARGMHLSGWYDAESRWFDVRESQLAPAAALASYSVGDVVLALVGTVEPTTATVFLHPLVEVTITREQVTSNDLDDLTSLMSPGEVLAARLVGAGPDWELSLLDVDDDEEVVPAAALLTGGPPWLELVDPFVEEPEPPSQPTLRVVPQEVAPPDEAPAVVAPAAPTPALLDRHRPAPATPSAPSGPSGKAVESLSLKVQALEAELRRLRPDLSAARDELRDLQREYKLLADVNETAQRRLHHQEQQLRHLKSRLRKAGSSRPAAEPAPVFADAEQGFRHAVVTAWASRTPLAEQVDAPLPGYDLGPDFLKSLAALEGVPAAKVADVVFEVLTDRAKDLTGRDLHQLRESEAGGAPYRRRPEDGATSWRVALQRNTPGARRLHYWRLPNGRVELSRVGHHDDVRP